MNNRLGVLCELLCYVCPKVLFFLHADGDYFGYTRHEPVGVCGQIIPVSFRFFTLMS